MPQPRKTSAATKQRAASPQKPESKPRRQRAATPSRSVPARRNMGARQTPPLSPDLVDYFGGQGMIDFIVAEYVPADATAGDVLRLLLEARRLGADPIRGDVYLAKGSSRDGGAFEYSVAAKRDALLAFAERQPSFRGWVAAPVYGNDHFELVDPTAEGTLRERAGIVHRRAPAEDRGELVAAWCAVDRDGREPTVFEALASEYMPEEAPSAKAGATDAEKWRYRSAHLVKIAMCWPLRMAFSLTDVVGAEELRRAAQPAAGQPATSAIFTDGPRDDLDARILDAHRRAQELDPLMWTAAKVRAQLASCDSDERREFLASEMEVEVARAELTRADPERLQARLAELLAFDASTLDGEDLAAYLAEKRAIAAALEAFDVAAA